ncbi:hypothetical protein INT43_006970 [Umbelopsis isabellina]|uniref:Thioredoxin n=1 Tax=Mortierella isabellina TaxID=91625 RepID=A0A8H7PZ11_MORIS|nr:hypothetical protein INT43_006970 [Umbelopsis isabellina]
MAIDNEPKNLQEFKSLIASDKLTAVDFHAQWCGPCKIVGPKFVKLVEVYPNVQFAKVDVDEGADIAEEYSIRAMPTFLFFKDGVKVGEVVGANIAAVEAKIKEFSS